MRMRLWARGKCEEIVLSSRQGRRTLYQYLAGYLKRLPIGHFSRPLGIPASFFFHFFFFARGSFRLLSRTDIAPFIATSLMPSKWRGYRSAFVLRESITAKMNGDRSLYPLPREQPSVLVFVSTMLELILCKGSSTSVLNSSAS